MAERRLSLPGLGSLPRASTPPVGPPESVPSERLSRRLLGFLALALVAELLIMAAGVQFFVRYTEQSAWQGRQGEAAGNAAATVGGFMGRVEDTLATVGLLKPTQLTDHPGTLDDILRANPALLEVIRLDPRGRVRASAFRDTPILANQFTIPQSNWFRATRTGKRYTGSVQVSSRGEPSIVMAVPAPGGEAVAARLKMDMLWDVVKDIRFGRQGRAYVVDHLGRIVAHTDPALVLAAASLADRPEFTALSNAPGNRWSGVFTNFRGDEVVGATAPVPGTDWVVVTELPESEAFGVSRVAAGLLGTGLIAFWLTIMYFTMRLLTSTIFRPLSALRAGAERIARQDLAYQVPVSRPDEIGQVTTAFNRMAAKLQRHEAEMADRASALAAEVTERKAAEEARARFADQLRISAEIAERLSAVRDPDRLMQDIVQALQSGFDLYHVHLYVNDAATDSLLVRAGSGAVGRALVEQGHVIALDARRSLVARAAREHAAVLVGDVSNDPGFLPNPLLPATRSEVAVPLLSRGLVLGVLDMQDNRPERFTQADVDIFSTLAGQIAVALENARLFSEIQATADRLRELDKLKSEFLATISHELRTPLNSVLGYSEIILEGIDGPIGPEAEEDVRAIHENGQHLLKLINDVLDLAKIEAGRMTLDLEDVPLPPLIDKILTANAGLLAGKPLTMTTDVSPDLPPVEADPLRLQQVLNNLISNAVKFTPQGAIEVHAWRENGSVAIAIADTGIGIAEEDIGTIFEKFRQLDGSYTRRANGTGLGLAITNHLVQMHGGTIGVVSELGRGTTFTVRLPVGQGDVT
jgi:signal transduction histidine kinase/HAMP domain-containing protein